MGEFLASDRTVNSTSQLENLISVTWPKTLGLWAGNPSPQCRRFIPGDNPSFFRDPRIYAMGLRNSFGMVFHPQTGHLWITENGPDRNDEVNRIVAGGNYGWPNVTGIATIQGFSILSLPSRLHWPTGIVTIPPNALYPPTFHNNLLFAEVNGGKFRRIVLAGAQLDHFGAHVAFNGGKGPLLDIIQGPGGYLYVSAFSAIYRVLPNQ